MPERGRRGRHCRAVPTSGRTPLQTFTTAFIAGDLEGAQRAQDAVAVLQQTFKYGNPNTIIKTAVALQGRNVGKCRAPFNYVPEEGLEAIKKVLADVAAKGMD